MKALLLVSTAIAALSAAPALAAPAPAVEADAAQSPHADDPASPTLVDVIVVTGARPLTPAVQVERPEARPVEGPDASALLSRVPGAARVGNGALSGQVQYRGLFGPRLNMRVDGQGFASGGPNLMDPPLHYAPVTLISSIEVDRGVSPVRHGPGLAGGVNAVLKRVGFEAGPDFVADWDLTAQGRTADGGVAFGGVVGAASERLRFNLIGAWEEGSDLSIPGGELRGSSYERGVYGLSAGVRGPRDELALDLRRQETGPTGNPPFAMDIRYFDTDVARLAYHGVRGEVDFDLTVGVSQVDHAMNNFDLRPSPPPAGRRETLASADTVTFGAAAALPMWAGTLRFGADLEQVDRQVRITNPGNPGFFIASLPDIETGRAGAFVEWTGPLGPVQAELGLRADRHVAEAGLAATGSAVPGGPTGLAAAFNAADRSREDTTVDAVARLWTDPVDGLSWRLTLARKTRAPGYVERFSWLPTEASGGLADGNIYVGDLGLRPETAWSLEAGFDYADHGVYLRPTVFVREIDDYIQGVPFDATPGVINSPQEMVAAMNGDPTPLRFANVGARLYGADIAAGARLDEDWRVDLVAAWVRGERTDIDDVLYRIAPPSVTAALTREGANWSVTFETRWAAGQDRVSRTNGEAVSDDWVTAGVYGDWSIRPGVTLAAGIENLFDNRYAEHLSGHNRISGPDVALGERLPAAGRGGFIRLSWSR